MSRQEAPRLRQAGMRSPAHVQGGDSCLIDRADYKSAPTKSLILNPLILI